MEMELAQSNSDYRVNLQVFEGPLDLLMHLIKKNDLDIYDIPVSFVLEEYMGYIDTLRELDIDLAGDFLLMAAELAHIKSRMLLPTETHDDEDDEFDPRADLVKRLLEYQQFKEASERLSHRAMLDRDVFKPRGVEKIESDEEAPIEGNVYDLIEAFSVILKKVPKESFHDVAVDRISINDRIYQITDLIKQGSTISLASLLEPPISRYDVVITFIALLEMCRLKMIRVHQSEACGSILIQCVMEEVKDEDVMKLVENEAKGFDRKELE